MDIGSVVSSGVAGAQALGGYFGQKEANRSNEAIAHHTSAANLASAREAMAFSGQQAKEQMRFQERMSSTAMQRMVKDYKKAGINPLLGLSGGGSSSPAGAAGSGTAATAQGYDHQNEYSQIGPSIASAIEGKRLSMNIARQKEELALMRSQKNNVDMDTVVKSKDIPKADMINKAYIYGNKVLESLKNNASKTMDQNLNQLKQESIKLRKKP